MNTISRLQITLLMTLCIGQSQIFAEKLSNAEQALGHEELALITEQQKDSVLNIIAELQPEILEKITKDENNLETNYSSIEKFIQKKNKEIQELLKIDSLQVARIAKIAIELADAQIKFEKTLAKQRSKNKHAYKIERFIRESFVEAERYLKMLYEKAGVQLQKATNNSVVYAQVMSEKALQHAKDFKNKIKISSPKFW